MSSLTKKNIAVLLKLKGKPSTEDPMNACGYRARIGTNDAIYTCIKLTGQGVI